MPTPNFLKDLVFFSKNGTNYNFSFDENENMWRGSIFLERVSRGLFETECIYVMQRYNGANGDVYGYPCVWNSGSQNDVYVFEWDNRVNIVDEIQLFDFENNCPMEDTSSLTYIEYDCPKISYFPYIVVDGLSAQGVVVNEAPCIHISFCNTNDEYNTFRRDLMLYYNYNGDLQKVGEFRVYAESVEEDERLKVLCKNLGYNITNEDYRWFKDTDIKEHIEDVSFTNIKRKEILIEGHNIYPFVGSYKALINVIKYFGYDNLTIKEWWKNVDYGTSEYGKYYIASSYSLSNSEVIKTKNNITLPSKRFRKTNKLTLAWDINRVKNGEISELGGLPQLEDTNTYTIEEAIIKLYGFKRKLEKEFLPIGTHIVDIVGEAFAFGKTGAIHNVSDNKTFVVNNGCKCDFEIFPKDFGYIEDLRPFGVRNHNVQHPLSGLQGVTLEELGGQVVGDYNIPDHRNVSYDYSEYHNPEKNLDELNGVSVAKPIRLYGNGLAGVLDAKNGTPWNYHKFYIEKNQYAGSWYLADFYRYFPNIAENSMRANEFGCVDEHLPDCEGIPVGCLIRLRCSGLDEVGTNRELNHARISWLVYKQAGETSEYLFTVTGTFDDGYGDVAIALPYVGTYSIEMKIYGYDNSVSVKDKINCFTVYPKNVEMCGWYKTVPELLGWDSNKTWDFLDCTWEYPTAGTEVTWDEAGSATYESADVATWLNEYCDEEDVNARVSLFNYDNPPDMDRVGAYFWDNFDGITWNDVPDLNWNNTVVTGNLPCWFVFGEFNTSGHSINLAGNILEIVDKDGNYGSFSFSQENDIDYWVNGLNNSQNSVIGKFWYNKVYAPQDQTPGDWAGIHIPDGFAIVAVAKKPGIGGDVMYAGFVDTQHQASLVDGVLTIHRIESNTVMKYFQKSVSYNPSWVDVKFLSRVQTVGKMTSVVLDYSNCKINGKTSPVWKVTNTTTGNTVSYSKKIFHYVFRETGCYSVTLELSDTNGNKYVGERKMFIVK